MIPGRKHNVTFLEKNIFPYWKSFIVVMTPVLVALLPLIVQTKEARCAYVVITVVIYWMTEAMPLAVSALIPVFAFPLLGIMSSGEVTLAYMKETNMMFLGGLMVAAAIEHCNLHKRIALFVILHVGQSPRRLLAGFMLTTMFLSMWISNTASTAMVVPIIDAIFKELQKKDSVPHNRSSDLEYSGDSFSSESGEVPADTPDRSSELTDMQKSSVNGSRDTKKMDFNFNPKPETDAPHNSDERAFRYMCFMGIAYAANVGGTGAITGTGPNLVIKGLLEREFTEPSGLNFATWMAFNVPGMLLCVLLGWIWLQLLFIGFGKKSRIHSLTSGNERRARAIIQAKYTDLGPISFHEGIVLTLFVILVILWVFRSPEIVPGWQSLFQAAWGNDIKVGAATPAILIAFLLFLIPAKPNFWCFQHSSGRKQLKPSEGCLTWNVVHQKIPWDIILLIGGGFAMASGSVKSGLSAWMGQQLQVLETLPVEAIVFIVCMIATFITEFVSNVAAATIFLPVLQEMALGIKVNPLYLMLPASVTCSYAFMLPAATAPNAIVFLAANMKITVMLRAGFVMNILCVLVINVMINTLGVAMFDLRTFPAWANSTTIQGGLV